MAEPDCRLPLMTRVVRFCASGVVATAIHFTVVTFAVYRLGADVTRANVVAFLVANCFTYAANALWSFEAGLSRRNYARFLTVSALQLTAAYGLSSILQQMGYAPAYAIAATMLAIPAIAFLMHNFWTFR